MTAYMQLHEKTDIRSSLGHEHVAKIESPAFSMIAIRNKRGLFIVHETDPGDDFSDPDDHEGDTEGEGFVMTRV
jgi:hypothetical protein